MDLILQSIGREIFFIMSNPIITFVFGIMVGILIVLPDLKK